MSSEKDPLPLPDNFDPEVNLPGREENGKTFHSTIPGMNFDPAANSVWFTRQDFQGNGDPVEVRGHRDPL